VLGGFLDLVDELLAAFLGEGGEDHADLLAVGLGVDAEVGGFQAADDVLEGAGVEGLDEDGGGIGVVREARAAGGQWACRSNRP